MYMSIQSERVVSAARDLLKSYGFFVDNLWHRDDIRFLCEQLHYPLLADEECMAVFGIANERFDGEYGMNWPELERALKQYMHQKERLEGTLSSPSSLR